VGELAATSVPDAFGGAAMFEKAAEQIAGALPLIIEGKYRRREAAVGRALQLAATMPDHYGEDEVEELAATMASLPSAIGCAVRLEAEDGGAAPLAVRAGATAGGQTSTRSFRLDGRVELEVSLWWGAEPHAEEEGFERVLAVFVSSLDRIERNRRLLAESETDPLTGIGNRRMASRALAAAMSRAERHGEQVSVLMLDLDKFKNVNDTLGHNIGDEVLAAFASMLANSMRPYDTVARIGGEEFLVICPDLDGIGAETVARRLIDATPRACTLALPDGWTQTVSLGLATSPEAATTGDRLMRRADDALYAAKREGRNRFAVAGHERPHRGR
jgi:diguanylate cyclase (GGDEF)-like protein